MGLDGRRISREATMLSLDELEAQRHGTWVQCVFHIITVSGGRPCCPQAQRPPDAGCTRQEARMRGTCTHSHGAAAGRRSEP